MIRRIVAFIVVTVLLASDLAVGQEVTTQPGEDAAYAKLLLAGLPVGSKIEVVLAQKGSRTIRGKLVSVSEDSLEVEQIRSGKALRQRVPFSDLKYLKKQGMSNRSKALIAIGVGAAAVAAALAALAVAFSGGMH